MEDGSLLPFALQYMKQLREKEHDFNFPYDHFQSQIGLCPNESSSCRLGEGNALVISLFCIDTPADVELAGKSDRKGLLRKLASLHTIIHSNILPTCNKNYRHCWFVGGSGISFGLHCCEGDSEERGIPHLRAVVHYGPHPLDELVAIAIMMRVSADLIRYYNHYVAIECWDVDDGQIMLIEGAEHLPTWVDDEIGVEGMAKRVYIVNGQIQLLPCYYKGISDGSNESTKGRYILTRKESLNALIDLMSRSIKSPPCQEQDSDVLAFNRFMQKRLEPFCKAISLKKDSSTQTRHLLVEYLHTAAIVVPMHLAIVLQYRPDLIPVAILTFCRRVSKDATTVHEVMDANAAQYDTIPFENLVYTKIMIPKILYAMLLTAAGQLPPPMKTPRHYKSMELNRIKRQCENGGMAYAHFRHAIEAGMRLSLGYEWIAKRNDSDFLISRPLVCCSAEERIMNHTSRIDIEAGGDGLWIQSSWDVGPNNSLIEDDIGPMIKCPVWYPEIVQGGICPISNPGKSVAQHLSDAFKFARKKNVDSNDLLRLFPIPRDSQVDSDDWLDVNSIDDLELKMKDITKFSNWKKPSDHEDELKLQAMDTLAQGVQTFIKGSSDLLKGVSSGDKQDNSEFSLNSQVYLMILHRVLQEDPTNLRLDDLSTVIPNQAHESADLLKFFSKEDLDWDKVEGMNAIDEDMKEIMMEMDEQLSAKDSDRLLNIEGSDIALPLSDPAAIRANVISNLLESLEAQEGHPGPVTTIFMEESTSNLKK